MSYSYNAGESRAFAMALQALSHTTLVALGLTEEEAERVRKWKSPPKGAQLQLTFEEPDCAMARSVEHLANNSRSPYSTARDFASLLGTTIQDRPMRELWLLLVGGFGQLLEFADEELFADYSEEYEAGADAPSDEDRMRLAREHADAATRSLSYAIQALRKSGAPSSFRAWLARAHKAIRVLVTDGETAATRRK
jgi:hypothetical protein